MWLFFKFVLGVELALIFNITATNNSILTSSKIKMHTC